jgi:hypothetical protein
MTVEKHVPLRKKAGGWWQLWCETCGEKLNSGRPGNGAGIRYLWHIENDAWFKHISEHVHNPEDAVLQAVQVCWDNPIPCDDVEQARKQIERTSCRASEVLAMLGLTEHNL